MIYTVDEVRLLLKLELEKRGFSQCDLARELGVTKAFVSDAMIGKRNPTGKILEFLGMKKNIRYERV